MSWQGRAKSTLWVLGWSSAGVTHGDPIPFLIPSRMFLPGQEWGAWGCRVGMGVKVVAVVLPSEGL